MVEIGHGGCAESSLIEGDAVGMKEIAEKELIRSDIEDDDDDDGPCRE